MRNYELLKKVAETAANRYASPEQRVFRILDVVRKERPELLEEKPKNPQQEAGRDY